MGHLCTIFEYKLDEILIKVKLLVLIFDNIVFVLFCFVCCVFTNGHINVI